MAGQAGRRWPAEVASLETTGGVSLDIFREYDVRGIAGEELTPEVARLVARAFVGWLEDTGGLRAPDGRVAVIGRDNRLSSPGLASGLERGFREAGWEVVDLGVVPTPVFYWAKLKQGIHTGVIVTGSHNEARFNGFKLAAGPGTIYGEDVREVGRRVCRLADHLAGRSAAAQTRTRQDAQAVPAAKATPGARTLDPIPGYTADLCGRVRLPEGRRKPRVAVDCGNGTAALVAPELFERLGCEVLPLYAELDGTFPGHWPDPVRPENLTKLQEVVRSEGADLGVAFDGDADRLGVVDDKGEILWGDVLMILFWREILGRCPGAEAIVEVKCSQALVDEIRRLGGRPVFHRTGHSLIKATMRETGALFAGEMSGHMFFADEYHGFDDALYAAARLLRIVTRAGRPLSELLADRPRYFTTPEMRLDCPDRLKFAVVEAVRRRFSGRGLEVVDVDGARVIFPDGRWLLVRASNTQPALVVRCEAKTPEGLRRVRSETWEALKAAGAEAGLVGDLVDCREEAGIEPS